MSTSTDHLKMLMEKVKQRATHAKSWNELIDAAKNNMIGKRNILDADDREQLRKALDFLQKTRKVSTQKELLDQLKDLTNKVGLKFASTGSSAFLSSDSFYVEVKTNVDEQNGSLVENVLIAHGKEPAESSPLLKQLIIDSKWAQLCQQLAGFNRFYPTNADSVTKLAAFKALKLVEQDLIKKQTSISGSDGLAAVRDNPLGFICPRDAGRPLRVHYFVEPYDLLDLNKNCMIEPTSQEFSEKSIGHYAELVVETSQTEQVLQKTSLFKGRAISPLDVDKGVTVCAKFAIQLDSPLPMSKSVYDKIITLTGLEVNPLKEANLLSMVIERAEAAPNGSFCGTLPVILPGQFHCYRLDVLSHGHLSGYLVDRMYFTQPHQVIEIIELLRHQLIFNSVLQTCVRPVSTEINNRRNSCRFDICFPNLSTVECLFENPIENSNTQFLLAKFNLSSMNVDVNSVTVKSFLSGDVGKSATEVFKKCWSIPVTMRSILKSVGYVDDNEDTKPDDDDMNDDHFANDDHDRMDVDDDDDHQSDKKKPTINDDQYWFNCDSTNSGANLTKKISRAWLPDIVTLKTNITHEPFQFTVHPVTTDNKTFSTNLLDIFKEIEIWKELIPPRPGQEPLKSPSLMPPLHPIQPQPPQTTQTHQSPRLQEMLTSGLGQVSRSEPLKLSHSRHWSTGSETSATLGELDMICQLASKSMTSDSMLSPTTVTPELPRSAHRPPSLAEVGRRSSIQDAIDSVMKGMGTPPEGQSPVNFQTQQGPSPQQAPDLSPRFSDSRNLLMPQSPTQSMAGRGRGGMMPPFMQSRSFDLGNLMPHQRISDPFDFEKSDPIEAGLVSPTSQNPLLTPASASPYLTSMGGPMPAQNFPFPPNFPTTNPQMKARGGSTTGTRRGRGRKAGNMGDRPVEGVKEGRRRGGTGTRRPRRPRGAASTSVSNMMMAQVSTSALPQLQQQSSSIFPSAVSVASAVMKMAESLQATQVQQIPTVSQPTQMPTLPPSALPQPFVNQQQQAKKPTVSGLDLEESSEENSPESEADDRLREQIQQVISSPPTKTNTFSEPMKSMFSEPPNLFESFQTNLGSSTESETPTTMTTIAEISPSMNTPTTVTTTMPAPPKLLAPRPKPNILSRSNRKGSLDMVIGKLKDKVGEKTLAKRPLDDVFDTEIHSDDQVEKIEDLPMTEEAYVQESEEIPAESDTLKVVIKKNLLTSSPGAPKSLLSRQKSDPANQGTKIQSKEKMKIKVQSTNDKFAALKEKGQNRKRKQSEHGRTESKNSKGAYKAPKLELPPVFEGISKSLKGFKIPKLVDDTPTAPPQLQATPPKITPEPQKLTTSQSTTSSGQRTPTKSILKQAPPILQPEQPIGSFPRPTGRKPLLPNPTASTTINVTRFPPATRPTRPIVGVQQPLESREISPEPTEEADLGNIRSPDDTTIGSPDQSDFTIDDSIVKSPNVLNTSKDSSDRSPELTIVEGE